MKTGRLALERGALSQVWRRKRVLGAQLAGNAALVAAIYLWLGIAEASWAEVVASAGLAVLILLAALWLHAATLASFHGAGPRAALRRLPRVLPWVMFGAAIVVAAVWLAGYAPRAGVWLSSWLTLRLRRPVSPGQMEWIYPTLLRALSVAALLALAPAASLAAGGGSLRTGWKVVARPRYWLACALLVLAGLYLPGRLVAWVPAFESLTARAVSAAVRFALAYVAAVTAWLTLAAVIASLARNELGRDAAAQPAEHSG